MEFMDSLDSLDHHHSAFEALQAPGPNERHHKIDAEQAIPLRAALMYDLLHAEAQLRSDPDAAALRLDGALRRIAVGWFAVRGLINPPDGELLQRLDALAPAIGAQLRLALHAPNVAARLVHCRAFLRAALADASESDGDPHTAAKVVAKTTITATITRQISIDIQSNSLSKNRSAQHASIR